MLLKAGILFVPTFYERSRICFQFFSCYKYDVVVIGGGIIGTAIAKILKENIKHAKVALVEKEIKLGQKQSSHNSQVIHAGIYYEPQSLKAKLCVEGAKYIYDYCTLKNIPVKKSGKLIIAADSLDKYRLKSLYVRAVENNVPDVQLLDNWKNVSDIQPNFRGVQAMWSPSSGNIDWEIVTKHFGDDFEYEGGDLFLNCDVNCIKESNDPVFPIVITEVNNKRVYFAKYVITCLGVTSGTLYDSNDNGYHNISLKVQYYKLNNKLSRFVRTNVYAMPHLDMPFIGIHLSPTVDGNVLLGPTAVPALQLNGYNEPTVDLKYLQNRLLTKHFGLLFLKNIWSCFNQVTEVLFDTQISKLKKYFPILSKNDILPGPSAIQGQLVTSDGDFFHDFVIEIFEGKGIRQRIINCRFIPSPGATSSLAIARFINNEVIKRLSN